jgi:uncharacterized delta-60 repeat protein
MNVNAVGAVIALAEDAQEDIFTGSWPAAEFSPAGVLDTTITPAPIMVSSHGGPIVFQPDGFDLEGESAPGVNRHDTDAQVVRFSQTGAVDSTFNNPPFDYSNEGDPGSDAMAALALQSDGQAIAAGGGFALARLTLDGNLDASFGQGGIVPTISFPGQNGGAGINAVVVQSDGKIVAVGTGFNNTSGLTSLVMARLLAD